MKIFVEIISFSSKFGFRASR